MRYNSANLVMEINRKIDPIVYPRIKAKIEQKVEDAKNDMISEFIEHPVSREIEAGPNLTSSLFLPPSHDMIDSNLFNFFGFDRTKENPVIPVKEALEQNTKIILINKKLNSPQNYTITANVIVPSYQDLQEITPLPWISTSWLSAVQDGLQGLNNTIFKIFRGGRSGTAFQAKYKNGPKAGQLIYVRSANWVGVGNTYISQILANFKSTIRGGESTQNKVPREFTSS